jgi:hypothetical protein
MMVSKGYWLSQKYKKNDNIHAFSRDLLQKPTKIIQ